MGRGDTVAAAHKPVAVICHAPWTLIDAGVIDGRRMTSYPSLQTDLKNAGADWVDEDVVVDRGLITSRSPKDLPAFDRALARVIRPTHCGTTGSREARCQPHAPW